MSHSQATLSSLISLWILINLITIPNNLYAQTTGNQTLHSHTLEAIINQADVLNTVSQINVGHSPNSMEIVSNKLYVANYDSNTVSVIDATNNRKIKDISVGRNPYSATFNPSSNTLYVANSRSDGISVIDGVTNKVVAAVTFNIHPGNSGQIICNTIDSAINQYLYVSFGTNCIAKPNKGFEFASWIENLGHNSTITLRTSTISDNPLNSFLNIFGITQNYTASTFNITRFGRL